MRFLLLLLAAFLLAGCATALEWANRPPVTQGNLLSEADIASLETGMSRAQVREQIGGPVLAGTFDPDRWDYIYYQTVAGASMGERQHLRLHFEDDILVRIEDNYQPPPPPEPVDEREPPGPDPMEDPMDAPTPAPDGPTGPSSPIPGA